jgi:hypothetical protein
VRGKGARLGEGCPKVRLSQDRMPIFALGTSLGSFRDYNICSALLRSGMLRSGLLRTGKLRSASISCHVS